MLWMEIYYETTEFIQPRISRTVKRTNVSLSPSIHAGLPVASLPPNLTIGDPTCVAFTLNDHRPAVTPKVLSLGNFQPLPSPDEIQTRPVSQTREQQS